MGKVRISLKSSDTLRKLSDMSKTRGRIGFKVGIINNPEVATYAAYNEFGWVQQITPKQAAYLNSILGSQVLKVNGTLQSPPRPFLRATAAAKAGEWKDLLSQAIKTLGPDRIKDAVEIVARQAQVDVQETIKNNGTDKQKFPDRSPLTLDLYKATMSKTSSGRPRKIESGSGAARPQALVLSGRLLQSIGYELTEE